MSLRADVSATFTADGADPFTVDAAFEVERGESLVVLGPSGSGKTLLLETVAGFHRHRGSVTLDGRPIDDRPPEERGFGFVFQDYALFPHLSVTENVDYGSRYHDGTRDPGELLAELGVDHLADRYPPTLSGGEKQRVALARSLAVDPEVLLLDEPLSALDVPTRRALRDDLADVLADATTVYVTHNRTTARALADRIVVMHDGRVVQAGTPEDVFERPVSPVVAEFTGANVVPLSAVPSLREGLDAEVPADGDVAFRPESVRLLDGAGADDGDGTAGGEPPDGGGLRGVVERVVREDAACRVRLSVDGATVDAFATSPPAVGETVRFAVPSDRVHPC